MAVKCDENKLGQSNINIISRTVPKDGSSSLFVYATAQLVVGRCMNSVYRKINKFILIDVIINLGQGLRCTEGLQNIQPNNQS